MSYPSTIDEMTLSIFAFPAIDSGLSDTNPDQNKQSDNYNIVAQPHATNASYYQRLYEVEDTFPIELLFASPSDHVDELHREFQTLASQWKKETMGVSSPSRIAMHPAYQRIMAIGKPILPMILRDLQQNRGNWFHALRYIAGRDAAAGTNSVSDARAAWLEWGYKNNYL